MIESITRLNHHNKIDPHHLLEIGAAPGTPIYYFKLSI